MIISCDFKKHIITVGDLQRILDHMDPLTPVCGTDTTCGVDEYRFYFDTISYEKDDEDPENAPAFFDSNIPIPGPVLVLRGQVTIPKPMEVKE